MSSLWLVCLSLVAAANAASLGGRSVNIPVQVVYDTPSSTLEDGPIDSRPVSVKNLDEKPQLSPEEIVEAEILNIPVRIDKIAAQNIDEDVVNAAEEAMKVSSGSSSSEESKEDKSAENSSEEESKEDETNEVNSDKNTLEGISKPVNQEPVVPTDIMPPITIVEVPVPDSLVPVVLPVLPDLVPPPLVASEVVLVPEVQPQINENNVAELEQQVELVQETNNLKSLLPEIIEPVVIVSETNVSETNNKLVEEAVNEELIEEVSQLKAMQEVDVPPKEITNSDVPVPELYPQQQVNVVVQLRATNPEVSAGNEQQLPVQASSTQAPIRPLVGLFNRLGENIGSALNNIRASTTAAPAPTITTANTNTAANVNDNSNRPDDAPPVQAAEVVAAPTAAPPAANLLGGLQQNFNTQLNNFGNRFNGFIDNLRPKQPEGVQNGAEVTPSNTPILNTVQKQFNNGLQGFSDTVNNAVYVINQNNQTNAAQKSPQNDEQSGGQEPPNQFIQAISNGAQQFQQQFTSFMESFTGQNQQQQQQQQQQQSDEQPANQPNNATNFGQQVISIFQNGMTALLQNFNRPNVQSTPPTTQGDENPDAPPPNNNNGGFLGVVQTFANNIGQTFNNFISGGQNASNPVQAIPTQISQAGQQLANVSQNLPGAQQIQAGISQIPGAQQVQNFTQQGVEQIQNLQTNIPGAEQIQNLQSNIPGPLQEIIPSGKQIQNSEEKSPAAEEQTAEQVVITEVAAVQNAEQSLPPAAEQLIEAVTQV